MPHEKLLFMHVAYDNKIKKAVTQTSIFSYNITLF